MNASHPISVGESDSVRIQIASRPAKLAAMRDGFHLLHLCLEAVHKDHQLLPHPRRGCRLPVRASKQRNVAPLAGEEIKGVNDLRKLRHVNTSPETQDHEWVASVVDICQLSVIRN
jgi:hypothetical protein